MMRPEPTSVGLLGSYSESLTWWATIKKTDIKAVLGLRQYKSALVLSLALEGKSVPWDWWSRLLCRFPPADFLYHSAPYHRSEIFITGSSIAVRGAVGIGGKVVLGEQTF